MSEAGELNATKELSERIDALEARVMFQDDTIETLNQTVMMQWREIEALKRQIAALGERLDEAQAGAEGPTNEPPPHY
ncbi:MULTISPECIES: SlyX family protein [unclassified Bradyrhizobium]|uniref:SlyX family protein n=1 Tax=unclassified Bradyrhizobium TaxID=2631580 RepID=UPI0028E71805|nr:MULTISPECIES: SlyX family protein [unclassified Bradyrhizobium]